MSNQFVDRHLASLQPLPYRPGMGEAARLFDVDEVLVDLARVLSRVTRVARFFRCGFWNGLLRHDELSATPAETGRSRCRGAIRVAGPPYKPGTVGLADTSNTHWRVRLFLAGTPISGGLGKGLVDWGDRAGWRISTFGAIPPSGRLAIDSTGTWQYSAACQWLRHRGYRRDTRGIGGHRHLPGAVLISMGGDRFTQNADFRRRAENRRTGSVPYGSAV